MDQLPVAIRLLLAGLIDGLASVFVGATGGRNISFAASSPAGELAAPSHKTMSQTTWYQNRGPASSSCLAANPNIGRFQALIANIKSPNAMSSRLESQC